MGKPEVVGEANDSQRDLGKPHLRRNVIGAGSTVNCTQRDH